MSNDELMQQKNSALQLALENGFSQKIINSISEFFDEYIKDGYITTIDGKVGQKLKLFTNYCIVVTKNETKKDELVNMFYQFDYEEDEEDGSLISSEQKANIIKGLLSGKLIQAGIGYVTSAAIDSKEKERLSEKRHREKERKIEKLITVGEHRINYNSLAKVDTYSAINTANGYIRFVPINISTDDIYECEYFFFNNSIPFESKKIKQRIEPIIDMLNDIILKTANEKAEIEEKNYKKRYIKIKLAKQILLRKFENSNNY